MKTIVLLWVFLVVLTIVVILQIVQHSQPTPNPRSCCGNAAVSPPISLLIAPILSASANEVPSELQGCGINQEEITEIRLFGQFAGCATATEGARMVFPHVDVEFNTDGARCGGTRRPMLHRAVHLQNVVYTATFRAGPPACVASSSVTFTFDSPDAAFANLFATAGEQTLTPILDRYALGWLNRGPLMECPPNPRFGGVRSRCGS